MDPSLHVFFAKSFSERGQQRLMESALDLLQENQTIIFTAYDTDEPPFDLIMTAGDHAIVIPPAGELANYSSLLPNLAQIISIEDYSQLVTDCPAIHLLWHMNERKIFFKDCETAPPEIECTPGILGGPCIPPQNDDPQPDPVDPQ